MREIKFRAWDYKKRVFSQIFDIFSIDMDESYRTYLPGLGKVYEEDIILEQYTGLKDKHGNEIYEGDIVKFWDCDDEWEDEDGIVHIDSFDISKVGEFGVITGSFPDFCSWTVNFAIDSDYIFEVLGNIHENPELLGDK